MAAALCKAPRALPAPQARPGTRRGRVALRVSAIADPQLVAATFPQVALGAAAAAVLVGLAPKPQPPPLGLRQPVSVDLEGGQVPLNTHGVGRGGKFPPFEGKIVAIERMGGRDAERDVTRVVIDTGGVAFHEGQAFGVIPPGTKLNSKGQRVPETVRLYSIASSRYGDAHDGRTCTLAVVRVFYKDAKGREQRGLCSNYISDRKVGDMLQMTGPSGTAMLLPHDHMRRRIVCVATGTGIAPFRSFWRRLFFDQVSGEPWGYQGKFWLLAGFANPDSELFGDELRAAAAANSGRCRVDIALSLTQRNARGGPLYVQDIIEANALQFVELLESSDAVFYFCGLRRMYASVMDVLRRVCAERGLDADAVIGALKKEHRWHVEVV